MIHPSAIIHPEAKLAANVSVGPWSIIEANVTLREGCEVGAHCHLQGPSEFGVNNKIYSFCALGGDTQDKKFKGGVSYLKVGDNNTFREFVTVQRGTEEDSSTIIGSNNHLMNYCHVAHDCCLGNHIVLSNNATLAGHVIVKDRAIFGGFAAAHQFVQVGEYAYVGAKSAAYMDVLPCVTVAGERAHVFGLNRVGLKRAGIKRDEMMAVKKAYTIIFHHNLSKQDAIAALAPLATQFNLVQKMLHALKNSHRGIAREAKRPISLEA